MTIPPICHASRRSGFTLIELLVVVSIIGLLIAILAPAVQSAREAGRRVQCVNNLHQIVLAVQNYESMAGVLPPGYNINSFSVFAHILPLLEQRQQYNAINFQLGALDLANTTVSSTSTTVLLCPSDGGSGRQGGWTNYAANAGYRSRKGGPAGCFDDSIALRDILDGTSQTVALAEWVITSAGEAGIGLSIQAFRLAPVGEGPENLDAFAARCSGLDSGTAKQVGPKGLDWVVGAPASTLYNHALSVNKKSCSDDSSISFGAWTATSRHPNGCNAAFVDGNVAFTRESTSLPIWRSLGSRSGGEVISASEF